MASCGIHSTSTKIFSYLAHLSITKCGVHPRYLGSSWFLTSNPASIDSPNWVTTLAWNFSPIPPPTAKLPSVVNLAHKQRMAKNWQTALKTLLLIDWLNMVEVDQTLEFLCISFPLSELLPQVHQLLIGSSYGWIRLQKKCENLYLLLPLDCKGEQLKRVMNGDDEYWHCCLFPAIGERRKVHDPFMLSRFPSTFPLQLAYRVDIKTNKGSACKFKCFYEITTKCIKSLATNLHS